ncbi:hypothetical protein KAW50_06200 [candidate division WOR-3 bacterium]|nr:hypothetical protein [candidate division WOR-3 bacterium]
MRNFFLFSVIFVFLGCAKNKKTIVFKEPYKEEVWLGFKFVPGKSVSYKQTQKTVTTIEAEEFVQTINSNTEIHTTQTVEDTGETISLRISFDDVVGTMRVESEMKRIKALDKLKGKVVSLKLSRSGKIIQLKGLEGMGYFRESGEKPERQFEEAFSFLPNKIVKIGESWTREYEGKIATYTLKGFEKKNGTTCAKIEVRSKIETTKTTEQQRMKGKIRITGKGKGEIFFDVNEGIVIESRSSASLEGEQEVSGPTLPEPINVPIYIDQETHTTLIESK